jgi:hypothetical protein
MLFAQKIKIFITSLFFKLQRLLPILFSLYLMTYSLAEVDLSDKLIQSIYYGGKKINKIVYEDIRKSSQNTSTEEELIENYYTNYLNQLEEHKNEIWSHNKPQKGEAIKDVGGNEFLNFTISPKKSRIYEKTAHLQHRKPEGKQPDIKDEFSRSLYSLYGNRTIFNIDLYDLEKLVNNSVLTDGQAVIFWESILQKKTDRLKSIYKPQQEQDLEIYLFNFIPLKSIGMLIITIFVGLILLKIQTDVLKVSLIYNVFSICLIYFLLENLFKWKHYTCASIMFSKLFLSLKFLFDSIFSSFGYSKEDYDIISNVSKTKNIEQLLIKLFILGTLTLIVGVLSFHRFNYYLNYILFYISLDFIIKLISFYAQYEVNAIFQPLRHSIAVAIGVVNFFISKFHRSLSRFNHNSLNRNMHDSFYIISDLYTCYCLSYFYDYLSTQANQISHLFQEKTNNEELSNKIKAIVANYKEMSKGINFFEDTLWLLSFLFAFFLSQFALLKSQYIMFYFAIHFVKLIFKVFGKLYKVKILRVCYCFAVFWIILFNHLMSLKNDSTLFDVSLLVFII